MNRENQDSTKLKNKARFPTEILQSEAELGVWGIKIKHKDAQGNYP
jgi:subtilisin-like proprotein convertase family protein